MSAPHTHPPTSASVFAQRFSATRRGARLARLLSALQLVDWGCPRGTDDHDAVTVVVAELAANAVLHGRVPGRDFALLLRYDDGLGLIRIEVSDTHPARPSRIGSSPTDSAPTGPAPDEEHGRGLLLVDALADRWGVRDRLGPGKTVWAERALSARAGRPAHGPPDQQSWPRHRPSAGSA
uniref:ATP-binding protein n=1 Tax=Streptomyces sp. NBC_01401 TaxID=2903854 RepID=A0AAU3GXD2_9ACTN